MTSEITEKPRSNATLWLLVAFFIIPVIAAWLYFFMGARPDTNNNGELIVPIIDIESLKLTDKSGTLLSRKALTPKWRLYYFVGSHCNKDCELSLYNMRQMNIALGKNSDRVEHAIAFLNSPDSAFNTLTASEHQQAIKVFSQAENISALLKLEGATSETQSIYLVDPLGNIMMRFSKDLSPRLILKDINKLLKISRVG
ncbi:hypothetical protein MNBD_GAMMA11-1669 [hydrothermal vent metagenome]|uniref:Thioredoxin domain-containing protein n=1 Tax=hydrothermal vent metagenome TaxID=652676 RepID=A0A3B0XN38_9ZZZZ